MRRPKKTVTINLADYLSAGTYNVKVKSKGTDIRDSAESNSVSCEVSGSLSDLTGTKWIFNNTFTATAGYGVFDLEAEDAETSGMWSSLYVGYEFDLISQDNNFIQSANNIVWMPAISYPQGEFTITGGTDATNPNLIAWLKANAIQNEFEIFPSDGGSD